MSILQEYNLKYIIVLAILPIILIISIGIFLLPKDDKIKTNTPIKQTDFAQNNMQSVPIATSTANAIIDTRPLTYSIWIPFWRRDKGIQEITPHLKKFQEISPFSYEVRSDGTLIDRLKMTNAPWPKLISSLRDLDIKLVPTIAWFDGSTTHSILSDPMSREKHISNIITLVTSNNFDGIDINYENKRAETKIYFSRFITELSEKLHNKKKILICSMEARTPLSSRFVIIPKDIEYANDYVVMNQYCDEIRILAYDQENIDLLLNREKGGSNIYAPVADKSWVEKVIRESIATIDQNKIVLAIPTYGYEYQVTRKGRSLIYDELRSVTYTDAMELAKNLNKIPERNSAGELSFTYIKETDTATSTATSTRLVWFTDASAISDKIRLAKKYKLKGIILFKADGETDSRVWDLF